MIFNIEKIQADLEKFTQLQEEELALAKTTAGQLPCPKGQGLKP